MQRERFEEYNSREVSPIKDKNPAETIIQTKAALDEAI